MINIREWAKRVDEVLERATPESLLEWFEKYDTSISEYVGVGEYTEFSKSNGYYTKENVEVTNPVAFNDECQVMEMSFVTTDNNPYCTAA